MKHQYSIKNGAVSLLPFTEEDSEQYRRLRNLEDNRKWFKTDLEITPDMQKSWYERYIQDDTEYMFSIVENVSGSFLGAVSLYCIDGQSKSAEIGRIIVDRRKARGKGYAVCALENTCIIGARLLGLRRVYAVIFADNIASILSFKRAGFTERGCLDSDTGRRMVQMEKTL